MEVYIISAYIHKNLHICWRPYFALPIGRIHAKLFGNDVISHRAGRVLNFFSSPRNWDSPNPSPPGECARPPGSGGEGNTRWRERGWESPNSDEGTYIVVLFILYMRTLRNISTGTNRSKVCMRLKNNLQDILGKSS